jgi:hypothetical protein
MSVPLAAAVAAPQAGLLDLERELVCSVSMAPKDLDQPYMLTFLDLYRNAFPTSYAPRLPSHLLRVMSERMVRLRI